MSKNTLRGRATHTRTSSSSVREELKRAARPLEQEADLNPLIDLIGNARIVMLGEASHGTHEYYEWRAAISRRLIDEKGFNFVAVEGDWPDCFAVNEFIKDPESTRTPREVLNIFNRWPTWMWGNWEVSRFIRWLHERNKKQPHGKRAGFYGLDVYSLWDSLRAVTKFLEERAPEYVPVAERAYQCFEPHGEEPYDYAHAIGLVPDTCEDEALELLLRTQEVRQKTKNGEALMSAEQNALIVRNAEEYYRTILRGDGKSWNVRDEHMMETLERLLDFHALNSRAIVWAHNTHVGDARATDMAAHGMVNIGSLARERLSDLGVVIVGFGSYKGEVIAGRAWGAPMQKMYLPSAWPESWDGMMHEVFRGNRFLNLTSGGDALCARHGQRAVGVVYHPEREYGNYVPTALSRRYDAFLYIDETTALKPFHLHPEADPDFPETYPYGV